jgi:hypothetical protein
MHECDGRGQLSLFPAGTGTRRTPLYGMTPEPVIVSGDASDPRLKSAMEVLDRSGMSYKVARSSAKTRTHGGLMVSHGKDSLADFSDKDLVEFLWSHGAKFEDS